MASFSDKSLCILVIIAAIFFYPGASIPNPKGSDAFRFPVPRRPIPVPHIKFPPPHPYTTYDLRGQEYGSTSIPKGSDAFRFPVPRRPIPLPHIKFPPPHPYTTYDLRGQEYGSASIPKGSDAFRFPVPRRPIPLPHIKFPPPHPYTTYDLREQKYGSASIPKGSDAFRFPVPRPRPHVPHIKSPPPRPYTTYDIRAQEYGENLAQKYFGDKLVNGFRWGYKQGKRIHSVARKCEDFTNVLEALSCPQPLQTSPLSSSANNVHCIVEVTNYSGTKGTCVQTYESSQYPPEATCILDQPNTLGSKCTA